MTHQSRKTTSTPHRLRTSQTTTTSTKPHLTRSNVAHFQPSTQNPSQKRSAQLARTQSPRLRDPATSAQAAMATSPIHPLSTTDRILSLTTTHEKSRSSVLRLHPYSVDKLVALLLTFWRACLLRLSVVVASLLHRPAMSRNCSVPEPWNYLKFSSLFS
jgi:hypothetical protein